MRGRATWCGRVVAVTALALAAAAPVAGAQGPVAPAAAAPSAVRWARTLEVGGNYVYGNSEQAIVSARGAVSRTSDAWGVRLDARYLIGATQRDGQQVMDRRSWVTALNVEHNPEQVHTQFAQLSAERSLELRIDQRVNAGVGYRYLIDCDTVYRLEASVAVLAEANALPQPVAGQPGPAPVVRSELARLATRVRYRTQLTERVNFDLVSSYRPEIAAPDRFLVSNFVGLSYAVTSWAGLRLSFQNDFDSLARSRGARSNHNGQILVGANTRF